MTDEEPPVDLHRLQNMVTGDGEKLIELVGEYLDEEAKLLHHLRQAISAGSARDMKWCAHKLGGLSATCGMSAIVIPLARLERNDEELVSSVHRDLLAEAERQSKRILAFLVSRNLTPDNSHLNEEYQP